MAMVSTPTFQLLLCRGYHIILYQDEIKLLSLWLILCVMCNISGLFHGFW